MLLIVYEVKYGKNICGGSRILTGGAPTPKVGTQTYIFGRKLHKNERILAPGEHPWCPP